jgi:hypothetical protein
MVCFLLIRGLSFLCTLVAACQLVAHPVGRPEFGKEAIFRLRVIESDPFLTDRAVPYLHT